MLFGAEHPAQRQRAFGREQVAVRPAHFSARAFAGAIAKLAGNRVRRCRFQADRNIHRAGFGAFDRLDLSRGDQPGLNHRPPQIDQRGGIIGLAGNEARNVLHMFGPEHLVARSHHDLAEAALGPRHHRHIQRGGVRGAIDDDLRIANHRERETAIVDCGAQTRRARDHRIRIDGIARIDPERAAECGGLRARRLHACNVHARKGVELPGLGIQHDQRSRGRFHARRHMCVVIAFGPQQCCQQGRILARPAIELRGVRGLADIGLQRRQLGKPVAEQAAGDIVDPVDAEIIAGVAGQRGRRIRRNRLWWGLGQIGPIDPQPRQRRERRLRIER
ncbi:hypothetical protein D9M73_128580 [compost metagenome]